MLFSLLVSIDVVSFACGYRMAAITRGRQQDICITTEDHRVSTVSVRIRRGGIHGWGRALLIECAKSSATIWLPVRAWLFHHCSLCRRAFLVVHRIQGRGRRRRRLRIPLEVAARAAFLLRPGGFFAMEHPDVQGDSSPAALRLPAPGRASRTTWTSTGARARSRPSAARPSTGWTDRSCGPLEPAQ